MQNSQQEHEGAAELSERRWFAVNHEALKLSAECQTLARVADIAEAEWADARARLRALEVILDSLGDEL